MIEFLKSGSGIHIKESQKGSFTKYCNGKVTSECISRGKNSPDPKIRKKATFAANARKWSHKKGGKAFVNGVNVLDSNPNAYKHVKKRYKMAQEGTKLTFGQKVNNIGKNIGSWLSNNQGLVNTAVSGITGIISANKQQKQADQFAEAKQAEMKSFKEKTWKDKYLENLKSQNDRSDIVNISRAYNQTSGDVAQAVQEKQQEIDSEVAAAQQQAAQAQGDAWGGLLKGAGEIAMNALSKSGVPSSKTPTTGSSTSSFWSNPSLTNQKQYGSVNSNGSINLGFGSTWNPMTGQKTSSFGGLSTPQLTPPSTNYSFLK